MNSGGHVTRGGPSGTNGLTLAALRVSLPHTHSHTVLQESGNNSSNGFRKLYYLSPPFVGSCAGFHHMSDAETVWGTRLENMT